MNITINTASQMFLTIGHTDKFEPVLFWKIGQRKKALSDVSNYLNDYSKIMQVCFDAGVTFSEQEERRIAAQCEANAKILAESIINRCVEYKNRFFTFLPRKNRFIK